jgi:hypothetical protein
VLALGNGEPERPNTTRTLPVSQRSAPAKKRRLLSNPKSPEQRATMLRTARPMRVKATAKASIRKPVAPRLRVDELDSRARKKSATLGLRTLESAPCRKIVASPALSVRPGEAKPSLPRIVLTPR